MAVNDANGKLTEEEFAPLQARYQREYDALVTYGQPPATIARKLAEWNKDRMEAGLPPVRTNQGFTPDDRDEMLRRLAAARGSK